MNFTTQELHYLAMNFVGEELQKMEFEFLTVNSQLKKHPQFVTFKKDEKKIFVLVKAAVSPEDYRKIPEYAHKMVAHAKKHNAKVWFAGVGITHASDIQQSPIKGEAYKLLFPGFQFLHE